jgi:uncharacterized surface protein with fasciclin (FAS1) repeats
MKRKALLLIGAVLVMSLGMVFSAAAQETNDNIVDIAAKSDDFDILHTAIVEAELADTLASADNTFTVFAPQDAAFNALLADNPDVLNTLLADPSGDLTTILTYHVVPGKYMSGDLEDGQMLTTVNGEELTVSLGDDGAFVDDAEIITVDIPAKNGVIHVIDSVLLPSTVTLPEPVVAEETEDETAEEATTEDTTSDDATTEEVTVDGSADDTSAELMTIAEVAADAGNFTQLLAALDSAGLADTFAQPGNYTVFAPTDEAFEALGDVDLSADELKSILLFHVVGDRLTRDQLATDDIIPTLDGRPLFVNRDGANIMNISGAKVLTYDIPASNGVIHVIDTVMVP